MKTIDLPDSLADLFSDPDRIRDAVAAYCRANQFRFTTILPELRGTRAYKGQFTPEQA